MSRQEQAALMAWLNSFSPSRSVTAFDQLSDGSILMEVMSSIDGTYFKSDFVHGTSGPSSGSWESRIFESNTLKGLYRLLHAFPVPLPHHPLSTASLPEPSFATIANAPDSTEGSEGLLQITRMCLAVAVWAPGNEGVIEKIQGLGETHMGYLMNSIEMEIMGTMPPDEGTQAQTYASRIKRSPGSRNLRPPSASPATRAEWDHVSSEKDEQVADSIRSIDDTKVDEVEKESATTRGTPCGVGAALGSRITAGTLNALQADISRVDEELAKTEEVLAQQNNHLRQLSKTVEGLGLKTDGIPKLQNQLDEFRHLTEKLKYSEDMVDTYQKRLDECADLRGEMRASRVTPRRVLHADKGQSLKAENATLVEATSNLEIELKKTGLAKRSIDWCHSQVEAIQQTLSDQASDIAELSHGLDITRAQLADIERERRRDREDIHLHRGALRETELATSPRVLARRVSKVNWYEGATLEEELDQEVGKTKTHLQSPSGPENARTTASVYESNSVRAIVLETLLEDARRARDRYHTDFLEARRNNLLLEAELEQVRSGPGVTKCIVEGRTSHLVERMCDSVGKVRPGTPGTLGTAEVVSMGECRALNNGSSTELSGCTVTQDGQMVTPIGCVVGRLVPGDSKIVLERLDHQAGTSSNVLGKETRRGNGSETNQNSLSSNGVSRRCSVAHEDVNAVGMLTAGELVVSASRGTAKGGADANSTAATIRHVPPIDDIPKFMGNTEQTGEFGRALVHVEADKKLAQQIAYCLTQLIDKTKLVCSMITRKIETAQRAPGETDEEELVRQTRCLVEEGGKLLCEANDIIRGLDPDDRIQAEVQHQSTTREGTPEEFYLACLLHDLTYIVAQTAENAKLDSVDSRHPMKEWRLLEEPLYEILRGVCLLNAGVFKFLGRSATPTRRSGKFATLTRMSCLGPRAIDNAFSTGRGSPRAVV